MNTLYITNNGRILIDENNNLHNVEYCREAIQSIYKAEGDTKIVYDKDGMSGELFAKAGDLVVSFYEKDYPNKIVILDSKEWRENIEAYDAAEQKRKENWAKKHADDDVKCDESEVCY